jgi:hypothetical protein
MKYINFHIILIPPKTEKKKRKKRKKEKKEKEKQLLRKGPGQERGKSERTKKSKSPEVKCEQREANNENTTHSYEDTWLGRWSGTPSLCKSYGDGDVELSCVSLCNPVSWIMRREFLHSLSLSLSLSLKNTRREENIWREEVFLSPTNFLPRKSVQ